MWREFPTGPEGIFLKKGKQVQVGPSGRFPFLWSTTPDPRDDRLYYAKSYIYPLFVAPFVLVFGTNGFLVFHALLLSVCLACGYTWLKATSPPGVAFGYAFAFLFASAAPVYLVWLTPELFNLGAGLRRDLPLELQAGGARERRRSGLALAQGPCIRRRRSGPHRHRGVLEADQHLRDRALAHLVGVEPPVAAGGACRRGVRVRGRRAVPGERRTSPASSTSRGATGTRSTGRRASRSSGPGPPSTTPACRGRPTPCRRTCC